MEDIVLSRKYPQVLQTNKANDLKPTSAKTEINKSMIGSLLPPRNTFIFYNIRGLSTLHTWIGQHAQIFLNGDFRTFSKERSQKILMSLFSNII